MNRALEVQEGYVKYKTYPKAEKVELPSPDRKGMALEEVIKKRRSLRSYLSQPVSLNEVSQILFAAQGITSEKSGRSLRTSPSAGALYPIECYLVAGNVEGLKAGLYHYSVLDHGLELVREGDLRKQFRAAALDQEMIEEAPVTLILTAIWERTKGKYGERGERYTYMEAGHISQNVDLQATSLGMGTVCIGAFSDEAIDALLEIDGKKESAVYIQSMGKIK